MHCIVLAGGEGKRIRQISKGIPKPLLPSGKTVVLDHILDWLFGSGISGVSLSLHYKPEVFKEYLKRCKYSGQIRIIVESQPLGTGGAVKHVLKNVPISDPFMVVNGDTLIDLQIQEMVESFLNQNCLAMIGLTYVERASRFGTVIFENLRALEFQEKTGSGPGWINNGCYLFYHKAYESLEGKFSMETDLFPDLIDRRQLFVYPSDGKFLDIGVPEDYERFLLEY